VKCFPDWLIDEIQAENLQICDWGCATGDGTDELSRQLGNVRIEGVDSSEGAIDVARRRYPAISFRSENFLVSPSQLRYDIVVTLNILPRFEHPWEVASKLLLLTRRYFVAVVPFREYERISDHFWTFDYSNIPIALDGSILVHSAVANTKEIESACWNGEQILLIYQKELTNKGPKRTLSDIHLESEWSEAEIGRTKKKAEDELNRVFLEPHGFRAETAMRAISNEVTSQSSGKLQAGGHTLIDDLIEARGRIDVLSKDAAAHLAERTKLERELAQSIQFGRRMAKVVEEMLAAPAWKMEQRRRFWLGRVRRIIYLLRRLFQVTMLHGLREALWRTWEIVRRRPGELQKSHNEEKFEALSIGRGDARDLGLDSLTASQREHPKSRLRDVKIGGKGCGEKRICMLVQDFHDGGLERVVIDVGAELQSLGVGCEILVVGEAGRAEGVARARNLNVVKFLGDIPGLVRYASQAQYEAVLAHHCYEPVVGIAMAGIPVVEVMHNAYHWQIENGTIREIRERYIDRIVAVSEFVSRFAQLKLDIPEWKIALIPNGLSLAELVRPPVEMLLERRRGSLASPRFVFAANLHPQKNHVAIVRAFAAIQQEFRNARLLIAGSLDARSELGAACLREISRTPRSQSIEILGSLNRRGLSLQFARSHVGLLPSSLEGFSIASLEYSHFALPSVLSETGGAREVSELCGGVTIARSAAFGIEDLCQEAILRRAMDPSQEVVGGIRNAMVESLARYSQLTEHLAGTVAHVNVFPIRNVALRYARLLSLSTSEVS